MVRWRESKKAKTDALEEAVTIRITDHLDSEIVELYSRNGLILGGKVVRNEKEKMTYVNSLSEQFPNAKIEKTTFYEIDIDDCTYEPVHLYAFFPKQLEILLRKNLYDLYERHVNVHIVLDLEDSLYPLTFEIGEEQPLDDGSAPFMDQIKRDYGGEDGRMSTIFENLMKDLTGKRVHKIEIDESFGFHKDKDDWLNDGMRAHDYEARLFVYVK